MAASPVPALANTAVAPAGADTPLAWDVLLHVITETTCHAGHLDAARELRRYNLGVACVYGLIEIALSLLDCYPGCPQDKARVVGRSAMCAAWVPATAAVSTRRMLIQSPQPYAPDTAAHDNAVSVSPGSWRASRSAGC
ncbi:hypothetical protein ACFTZ8_17000 [Streptomyces fungicidicus]|uniref:hypothetical protein n=1 Tax=Streptomyces fungicidicus TaxID=68203 RepID=UPI0033C96DA0